MISTITLAKNLNINELLMLVIIVFFVIFCVKSKRAGKGKRYSTASFRGKWNDGVRFKGVDVTGKDLRDEIMIRMEEELKKRNIPAEVAPAGVASRKHFAFNWMPMIVIKNTDSKNKYFDLAIVVNFDTLTFPLLGESKENTKYNTHKLYKDENTFWGDVKSVFYHADEFKLQQEANWRQDVIEVFDYIVSQS